MLAVVALTDSEATFTGTTMRRISGSASDVLDALTALGDNTPSDNMTSVTLSGTADASDISDILAFGFVTDLIGTGITAINGSSAEVKDAIADLDDSIAGNFTSRITGTVVPADLKAVNDAASGEITIVVVDENLTDSPQNLADAFDEITSYEGNIVLTGQHTTEQLTAINEATIGSITTHATYNLEGSEP